MMGRSFPFIRKFSWRSKLMLSGTAAIFFTFFLFNFLEYHMVSKWMLKREETIVHRTLAEITAFYKEKDNRLNELYIERSDDLLKKLNDKNQLIRVYDQNGQILVSNKNGDFPILEPVPASIKTMDHIKSEDNETIVARSPLNSDKFHGTIEIVRELTAYNKMMDHLFMVMTSFGIVAILLSALSGYFLAKQFLKPLRNLAFAMKRIKSNGFQERMAISGGRDELSVLSNLFNEMMDEIEKSFQQQKQFIEDASHELRTPISILEGHVSLLNRWGKKDEAILEESLAASLHELSRLKKLVVDLLELTRAENTRMIIQNEKVNTELVIRKVIKNFEVLRPDFEFLLDIKGQLEHIWISPEHLQQILIILVDNSIKYSLNDNKVFVSAHQEGDIICLAVKDNGIGISPEHVSKVFNRFYRIDKARSRESGGTGLGLSIAKRLVEKYNGHIFIDSQEGSGTVVTIQLPIK